MQEVVLKAGTLSNQSVLNDYNRQVNQNFTEAASTTLSTKTVNLQINASDLVLDGSTFTPPIQRQPSILTSIWLSGEGNGEVIDIIKGYIFNSGYYDIIIAPIDEVKNNVKISVL